MDKITVSMHRRPQLWASGLVAASWKNVFFTSEKVGKTCEMCVENLRKTCYAIRFSKRLPQGRLDNQSSAVSCGKNERAFIMASVRQMAKGNR